MNEKRLLEIAIELMAIYHHRHDHEITRAHRKADAEARILALTPPEGWPGKNAEQRDHERARALATDETLMARRKLLTEDEENIASTETQIRILETERRALEWGIRAEMVRALSGNRNDASQPVEENGLDDAADMAMVTEVQEEFQEDLPF